MSEPHLLLTTAAIRSIEERAARALPPHAMMRRAAQAAARFIARHWSSQLIVVLCGPGNNGGDGAMLARLLHEAGRTVKVWALPTGGQLPADARQAWEECPPQSIQAGQPHDAALPADRSVLIVDALFGIGLTRELSAAAQCWINWANAHPADILALDVPSGLDADSGTAQTVTIDAARTLTFIADKPGLRTQDGADHCGHVSVASLDLPAEAWPPIPAFDQAGHQAADKIVDHGDIGFLTSQADCPQLFVARQQNTHKGSFGTLGLLAGAPGMAGAALLASRAALRLGAGKVLVGLAQSGAPAMPCDPLQPELMLRNAPDLLQHRTQLGIGVWVAGCGMGESAEAHGWLEDLLRHDTDAPLVLDADALIILSGAPELGHLLAKRGGIKVLTPHPREASRLLGCDTHAVQAARIANAQKVSQLYGAWTVLKGAGTVVSAPDGAWSINGSGNAGLATAGTGDVLAGMLGALLAQGLSAPAAVRGGVWLHGAAADYLTARGIGPMGLTASEIIDAARAIRNALAP